MQNGGGRENSELRLETTRRALLWLCAGVFVALAAWVVLFPYTGEGDAISHFFIARLAFHDPPCAITAFARPLHKLLLMFPAQGGMLSARLAAALVFTALVWQTIRLAEESGLRRAMLIAPLLLFEPYTFALAADTMTEVPMALGIVIAIRLWQHRQTIASCLLVSFLPMIRPEGFFFIAMWAVMSLVIPGLGPWRRRIVAGAMLAVGPLCWLLLGYLLARDPLFMPRFWNWPAGSYEAYGRGSIWHHIVRWPAYCGPVLLLLFLAGLRRSMSRRMWLPWAAWLVVFTVHSILYWGGWFAALGLLRILVTTSPITAMVCLCGWNAAADLLAHRGVSSGKQRVLARTAIVAAAAWAVGHYWLIPERYHYMPIQRVAHYLHDNVLDETAPGFFISDRILLAELDYPRLPRTTSIAASRFDRAEQLAALAKLPAGSIGMWDNQRGVTWYGVSIEELEQLGYTVLFEAAQAVPDPWGHLVKGRPWFVRLRYVVLRKDCKPET